MSKKTTKVKKSAKPKAAAKSATAAKAKARNWELPAEEIKALKAEAKGSGTFPNPYRSGTYHFLVEATAALGLDEWHPFDTVKARVEKLMGDEAWAAFVNKMPRNEATAKDADGRLLQSLTVLQRQDDYGRKLAQVGGVIDLKREGNGIMIRLDTKSRGRKKPEKLGRRAPSDAKSAE